MSGWKQKWWTAVNTALSALLYLFSFAANINSLVSYYNYTYRCPYAALDSTLLRHDSVCRAVRSNHNLHRLFNAFWDSLALLMVVHGTNAFIFWVTLDPRLHPFRLAYFMPLIQLYRLIQLFRYTARLQEFQETHKESRSLYSLLGASLETAYQFLLQFVVVVRLGEYIMGSSNPNQQAQRIPMDLIVSLIASIVSSAYNTSMGIVLLIDNKNLRMSSIICVALVAGCQAIASLLIRAVNVGSLIAHLSSRGLPSSLIIYMVVGVMVHWVSIGLFMTKHRGSGGWCLLIGHSFALALVTKHIGPIYVSLKLGKCPCLLIGDTVLHISVELVGVALLYLLQRQQFPCHLRHIGGLEVERNRYLTCNMFLGIHGSSFLVLIFTTLLVVWLLSRSDALPRSEIDARSTPTSAGALSRSDIDARSTPTSAENFCHVSMENPSGFMNNHNAQNSKLVCDIDARSTPTSADALSRSDIDARSTPTSAENFCSGSMENPSRFMDKHKTQNSKLICVHLKSSLKTFLFVITFLLNKRSRASFAFICGNRLPPMMSNMN